MHVGERHSPARPSSGRLAPSRRVAACVALAAALGPLAGCGLLPAPSEPRVERLVAEDQQVRVDELRVRGQTRELSVKPKSGAKAYDIVPPRSDGQAGGAAGQRVWPVLSF